MYEIFFDNSAGLRYVWAASLWAYVFSEASANLCRMLTAANSLFDPFNSSIQRRIGRFSAIDRRS
jgi:hypothetical protein